MWTATYRLDPMKAMITSVLGRIWGGAYFSSFAPFHMQNLSRQPLATTSWVRVRNRLSGINGADLQMVAANSDFRTALAALPHPRRLYMGQEVVGEVIEVGDDVQRLQVGDRVVLQYEPNCLSAGISTPCRSCANGYFNLCENGMLPGPLPFGGGWCEEMLLSEQQLFRVPDTMSDEQAVMLTPLAIALHGVLRHLPQPGEHVLIIGAGTIGLLTLQLLRALVSSLEISVLARHSFQVEQATRLGADHIVYPQDSYMGIKRITHAQLYRNFPGNQMLLGGYDVIYDATGKNRTLHHALRWLRAQGTLVAIGKAANMTRMDLSPIWHQELRIVGSHGHGVERWPLDSTSRRATFEVAVELIERGMVRPDNLITHHFALTNYQQALVTAAGKRESRAIKVVFDFSLMPATVVPNVRASAMKRRPTTVTVAEPEQEEHEDEEPYVRYMEPIDHPYQDEETPPAEQEEDIHEGKTIRELPPLPAINTPETEYAQVESHTEPYQLAPLEQETVEEYRYEPDEQSEAHMYQDQVYVDEQNSWQSETAFDPDTESSQQQYQETRNSTTSRYALERNERSRSRKKGRR